VIARAIPLVIVVAALSPWVASAQLWVAVEQPGDDCGS